MSKYKNIVGETIGGWKVISETLERNPTMFICKCVCGNIVKVRSGDLLNGHSKCCINCRKKTHGDTGTKLHRAWKDIKARCNNPNYKSYIRYGGRGIKVCNEWEISYDRFKEWSLKNGFSESLTIDRINNNGNYEPSNCRWTTWSVQNKNKNFKIYNVNGVSKTLKEWSEYYNIPYTTLYQRIRFQNQSIERALRI